MANSTGVSAKAYPIFSRIKGWKEVLNMLSSLRNYSLSEIAQKKMEIITFYDEFGEKATIKAFGADRKVVSRWRKRLAENKGRLESLIPYSTKPKTVRRVSYTQKIVGFIKEYRKDHPRTGKEKIKIGLDEYCVNVGIKTVSESTVGNIIKRHKFFFQKSGRIYHNPDSKWARNEAKKKKRLRVKHPPKLDDFGHIQSDAVQRITDGIRDYFISAIDAKMKFTLTLNYKSLTSRNNKDLYQRFRSVYPGKIKDWQSDNGSENLGEFDKQLEKDQIPHFFSYPRCPKINTYIERYNRTVQEEFIDNNLDIIHDKILFNQKLADYLIWYNSKRPHKSLGLKSPLQYLLEKGGMSQKYLTYTPSVAPK
jgi:putative transposase